MPLTDLEPETLKRVQAFMLAAQQAGTPVRPIEPVVRTWAEQDALYAQGRTKPSTVGCKHPGEKNRRPVGSCQDHPLGAVVTHAQGGQSFHNFGRAVDVIFLTPDGHGTYDGDWEALAQVGESCGLEAGYRWPEPKTDEDHFQFTGGQTLEQLRDAYLAEKAQEKPQEAAASA